MRMKSIKGTRPAVAIAAISLLTMSATPVHAQGPGWTANATVIKMVVTNTGGINVRLSPELSGCVSQSNYGPLFASIYPSHPGIDRMKADLLAAYVTGGTVCPVLDRQQLHGRRIASRRLVIDESLPAGSGRDGPQSTDRVRAANVFN